MRENNRETQRINNIKNLEDREKRKNDNGKSKDRKEQDIYIENDYDADLFSQNKKPRTDDRPPRRTDLL
eukprot:1449905-Heterocapsa_arctica.AAC.1